MNKIFLTIIISLSSFINHAQNFVYNIGQHRIDTVVNENYESYGIQMVTPTPEDITFKWEVISNSFNLNWSYSVCDYNGCYVGFPSSATMAPITATEMSNGTFGFIKCNITCGAFYDEGMVQLYVYDSNDYNRGDTISFYIVWPTPVGSITEQNIQFSTNPNPVKNDLNISNNSSKKGAFVITNMLGEKIQHGIIESEQSLKLNVSDFNNGTYIVTFVSDDGVSSYNKRIIKN